MTCLSVIIPAHNEADRILNTLNQVSQFLQYRPYRSEIIIVENGSRDQTSTIVENFIAANPGWPITSMINLPTGDKGLAVKAGMLAAHGKMRYMADADLATPIWCVEDFIYTMKKTKAALVIGNRYDPDGQTLTRQLMSTMFLAATRWILGPGIQDTQAGFKLFTARAAEQIFPMLQIHGWAFDVEVLHLAKQMGLEIKQLQIPWERQPGSKVKLMDPLRMLMDLARIKQAHDAIKA